MPAPPALLDEDVRLGLVPVLSDRGFDVLSVLHAGPRNVDDAIVLESAVERGRVMVTHNTDDYKALQAAYEREGRSHPGIVCVPQLGSLSRRALRVAMMLDWIADQPHASRLFVWGQLQQLLERGLRLPGYSEIEVLQVLGRA
jgi:predicted nuclease of predicted toxin-antitoxin system